jgi:hypothetical protein
MGMLPFQSQLVSWHLTIKRAPVKINSQLLKMSLAAAAAAGLTEHSCQVSQGGDSEGAAAGGCIACSWGAGIAGIAVS